MSIKTYLQIGSSRKEPWEKAASKIRILKIISESDEKRQLAAVFMRFGSTVIFTRSIKMSNSAQAVSS